MQEIPKNSRVTPTRWCRWESTYEDVTVTFATNSEKQLHITCATPATKPEEITPTGAKKKTGTSGLWV